MSNQTPDRSHASGTFVPVVAPPFDTSIVNSKAIKSFVRNSAGNYTVGLTNGLAFAEGNAEAALPANFLGIAGATIAPNGLSVLVTVFDLSGVPVDPPTFGLEVRSVEEGEGQGPQPALPGPPVAPGGSKLIGWSRVDAGGNILQQTGLVQAVSNPPTGIYQYTLNVGLPALVAVSAFQDGNIAGQIVGAVSSATTAEIRCMDASGAGAQRGHFAYFYQL